MKYFHISLVFKPKDLPKWLIDFRIKYDKPYPYHLTLKNETEVKERDVELLKKLVRKISTKYFLKELEMVFKNVIIKETSKGYCIMITAQENSSMRNLQAEIIEETSSFGKVYSAEHAEFEKSFTPHITIGRHLTNRQLLQAEKELPNKICFETKPEKLVLTIVNRPVIEERLREQNRNYCFFEN